MFKNLSLSQKNFVIFGLILLMFIGNLATIFWIKNSKDESAVNSVNAAGRNRMLSQRISASSFQILTGNETAVKNLEKAIFLHDSSLSALKHGGFAPGMNMETPIPPVSGSAIEEIKKVEELWKPFKQNAKKILANKEVMQANIHIGANYTNLLKANNALVQGFIKDETLAKESPEVIKAVINVAGRNRMLSQRIGLMSFKVLQGDTSSIEKLKKTIDLHDKSFNALANGGELKGQSVIFPKASPELNEKIENIQNLWTPYKESAEKIALSNEYLNSLIQIGENYTDLLVQNNKLVKAIVAENKLKEEATLAFLDKVLLFFSSLLFIVIGLGVWMNRAIVVPLRTISTEVKNLSYGKIPEPLEIKQKDEIGELSESINKVFDNVNSYSKFAEEIGNGNFKYEFATASDYDVLGKSLLGMRDQLELVEEESKVRNWKTEGLAKFADILRLRDSNLTDFGRMVVSNIVKYVEANQGALYIVNDLNPDDICLELTGKYAYDRIKHDEHIIRPGQGLVGQVFQEGKYVYMTDVPQDFIKIQSGLGDANPNAVLIIPLIINDKIMGVMEFASFTEFSDAKIDFLLTLSESIASTIDSVKIGENTRNLLNESQSLEKNLKSREEEMRQTMEEMEDREKELLKEIDILQNKES